jgi:peptide/nickel transport system permease protein
MSVLYLPTARHVRRLTARLVGGELQRFLLRRVGQAVLVLFCVATITFFVVRLTGDPVKAMLPAEATIDQENSLRRQLGLDRPLAVQYLAFLVNALRLDFGQSLFFHQPAFTIIADRMPATIQLALGALVFALLIAIPAGILAAVKRGTITDSSVVASVLIGQSTPAFFVGILLILTFAVTLKILPASGIGGFDHLILPSITLGLYSMAMIARLLRSSLIDVLGEDYIRTARSKGLSNWQVIRDHGLRNASLPVITIVGLEIGSLLGGAILTEQVFSWPGVGRLTVQAITNRDFPLMQAIVLFLSVIFVVTNLLVDVAYAFLDPRVRLS